MKIINFCKRIFNHYTRPQLSIRHRISNIIILAALIMQVPAIIGSIVVGTSALGMTVQIIMTITIFAFLLIADKHPDSQVPFTIMLGIINFVVFPLMFFGCGGRTTGMIMWMLLGAIFAYLLLTGVYRYASFTLNLVAFSACLFAQENYPQYVKFLSSAKEEIADVIFGYAMATLAIGGVFAYTTNVYEKQRKELADRDKELREMNDALEKASQAKSEFLASMSHEIRTPINAVLGMDEMIIRDSEEGQIVDYAKDIASAGKQLLSLVNDILDFSKIESGKMELVLEDYDLYTLIKDCNNMISQRAKDKNLNFIIENDPEIPAMLYGDSVRIRQMVVNLLSNSVKYTEKGFIKLSIGFSDDTETGYINLEISVTDSGIGIRKENLDTLFDSFTRVDEKAHRNIEGTGLGLAICKRLTELMNGEITVTSEYGKGSEFCISIPQKVVKRIPVGRFDTKEVHHTETKKHESSFTAEQANILIVDDVMVNLNVAKLLLRDTLVKTDTADGGRAAVEKCMKKKYDLILMDHMMPEMDGIEALQKIRAESELNKDTPMIALTANAIQGAEKMYLDAGFASYLTKPIKADLLEQSLADFLPKELVTRKN